MILGIFSSQESSLRFMSLAANALKTKLKGQLSIALLTSREHSYMREYIGADMAFSELQPLVDWCEKEYGKFK